MMQTTTFLLTVVLGIITPTSGATLLNGVAPVISETIHAVANGDIDVEIELPASRLGAPKSPTGACCHEDGTCDVVVEAECVGDWLGAGTTCDRCPCIVSCPPGAVFEQEPCGEDANGGCGMMIPTYEPIEFDRPVCGTTWAWNSIRDTDWYQITVSSPTLFTFTVEADFDVLIGLIATHPPGAADCNAMIGLDPWALGAACETATVDTACLPAGTYWFWISSQAFDGLPCGEGNDYVATLTGIACDVWGACCYHDGYECLDTNELECDALDGFWHAGEYCESFECGGGSCPEAAIFVDILTDNYPSETSWIITDYYTGELIGSGGLYNRANYLYSEGLCVDFDRCFNFTIYDAYGDGICCDDGMGYYRVFYEDALVCAGGDFYDEETCEGFGNGCVPPIGACCNHGLECIATNTEDECDALDGDWYRDETCPEFACPECSVDFCLDVPVYVTGATCGAGDDCGLRDTEEHEYRITLPRYGNWVFSLCGSSFDTYLYVGTTRCGREVGSNDDYCGLQSEITAFLPPGDYFVTIEGYDSCGDYVLTVEDASCCDLACPPFGVPEGEPDCHDNYVDEFNGGCQTPPYVFSPITCNETVCGTSGTYLFNGSNYRDSDWYEIDLPAAATLTWEICAAFPAEIVILDANQGGCSAPPVILDLEYAPACTMASAQASVAAGTYWLYVSPSTFEGVPCGVPYVATLTVDPNVCICGDFDTDGDVDVDDFYFFLDAYGTCAGDPRYREDCDFDQDECITLVDYQRWMDCYRE